MGFTHCNEFMNLARDCECSSPGSLELGIQAPHGGCLGFGASYDVHICAPTTLGIYVLGATSADGRSCSFTVRPRREIELCIYVVLVLRISFVFCFCCIDFCVSLFKDSGI